MVIPSSYSHSHQPEGDKNKLLRFRRGFLQVFDFTCYSSGTEMQPKCSYYLAAASHITATTPLGIVSFREQKLSPRCQDKLQHWPNKQHNQLLLQNWNTKGKKAFQQFCLQRELSSGAAGNSAQLSVRQAPEEQKSPPRSETRTLISADSKSHQPRDFRGGWWYFVVYRTESKLDWKAQTLGS